jgi:RimJ/RimL family protein N-acetyltransferase
MISEDGFVFRKGKKGDKQPADWGADIENDFPEFVLELRGKQVASARTRHGENHIFFISSFEWNKGYCTKFLELWEKYAKEKGYSEIIVSYVDTDAGHISIY